ncbi:MAG: YezD family protein [Sandaracinobacter sp.]
MVAALDRIRFGDIRLTIYEGRLVQVDVTERTRLPQGC